MEDQELHPYLRRLQEGDKSAFHMIYSHTHQQVYRTVYFLASHKQDTNDIVSEIYLELYRSISNYDFNQPFRSWLNGLIVRQSSNWHRKLWRKFRIFQRSKMLEVEEPQEEVGDRLLQSEKSEELLELVDSLSYKLKEVIVLRYYQENTFEEIASLLNIPVGTVKSRHHSAIQKLRQLKGYEKNESKEVSPHVS